MESADNFWNLDLISNSYMLRLPDFDCQVY